MQCEWGGWGKTLIAFSMDATVAGLWGDSPTTAAELRGDTGKRKEEGGEGNQKMEMRGVERIMEGEAHHCPH